MRRLIDEEVHFRYFRMSQARSDDLLRRISPLIIHQGTHQSPVSPAERLSVTVRILATGNSQQSVADSYRLGKSTVHYIMKETYKALWTALKDEYLSIPTVEEWRTIAADNWRYWNFPVCLGSLDGKHVAIKAPPRSGSDYYNYKKYSSIILLAAVDAKYKFTLVDIGAYGRESDGGVFSRSAFGIQLENDTLPIPVPTHLPGTDVEVPYVFVGDEAFPLKKYLMRPYPGRDLPIDKRVFNYRLSRNRRIVENAFGILAARWRIFGRPIEAKPENVDHVVKATIVLHNYLLSTDSSIEPNVRYVPPRFVDFMGEDGDIRPGQWRLITRGDTNLRDVGRMGANIATRNATNIRDTFKNYFQSNSGMVPWQNELVNRGAEPMI
ncbi:Protein ALP1-like [Holothuria leucospilota]|uniref:Protein ALP1-like n=1 Tax=Holothuria leucospilota TaxID=206669 RepID=A0A9Q0YN79_HOLLE|nr:Protein ALP1-like [Holothuria leucospilota]